METCVSQRPTDEESPESRMREIRLSGLMRGGQMQANRQLRSVQLAKSSLRPLYRYFFGEGMGYDSFEHSTTAIGTQRSHLLFPAVEPYFKSREEAF